jgi:type I restriction enzyme R subunit
MGEALPALHLLCNLGWNFLTPAQALALRGGTRDVLLKPRLVEVLQARRYDYKGRQYPLSGSGIEQIVRELSALPLSGGLLAANERLYGQLAQGITITEFMPDGRTHQPTIPIIDWADPAANRWDVTAGPAVLATPGTHSRAPGAVGYVNGLPLVVVEAAPPAGEDAGADGTAVQAGIRRHLQHQRPDEIPQLFACAQLLLALGPAEGRYGTTATAAGLWARWHDEQFDAAHVAAAKNAVPPAPVRDALLDGQPAALAAHFQARWSQPMEPTDADRLLVGLLTPARLLEFLRGHVLFGGTPGKVVARAAQFFGTRALLARVRQFGADGGHEGGVLWQAGGPDPGFTLVFAARTLLREAAPAGCRVVVVTDRVGLEGWLSRPLVPGASGAAAPSPQAGERSRVLTGRDLARRIGSGTERLIVTPVRKFNTACKLPECRSASPHLVVLFDGDPGSEMHERVRKTLPRAACIVFTGTPLEKEEEAPYPFGPQAARMDVREPEAPYRVAPPGGPPSPHAGPHAAAYAEAVKQALAAQSAPGDEAALAEEARAIDAVVQRAVAEHSLHPQDIEAAIRQALLPRLFALLGLDAAKAVIDQVLRTIATSPGRGE